MKQVQVINAIKALNTLSEQPLPLPISYKLFKLRKWLQPAWDFQIEQEKEIFKLYPPEKIENGMFKFKSPEDAQGFKDKMAELGELQAEITYEPINISMSEDIMLTPANIEALQDFVFFTEPEGALTK